MCFASLINTQHSHLQNKLEMAKEALAKLELQIKCAICLDTYRDPKLLQCSHVYCSVCLVRLVVRDHHGQLSITCPSCRQTTSVPDNGTPGLLPAFQVNQLLEIWDDLQKSTDPIAQLERVDSNVACLVSGKKATHLCLEHKEEELTLFCETCQLVICWHCTIQSHNGHKYDLITEVFEKHRDELKACLGPVEESLVSVHETLSQIDSSCNALSVHRSSMEDGIYSSIRMLQEILDKRLVQLVNQLQENTKEKLVSLTARRGKIDAVQSQFKSCAELMKMSLDSNSQVEFFIMKASMIKLANEVTTEFKGLPSYNIPQPDTVFSVSSDMATLCENVGSILEPTMPDVSACCVEGDDFLVGVVRELSTVTVHTVNMNGEPCEIETDSLHCKLVSDIVSTRVTGTVEKVGKNQYRCGYWPNVKGKHHLRLTINDQCIKDSPFAVLVSLPVQHITSPVFVISKVDKPWGVATIADRGVVVSNRFRHCLSFFGPSGTKLGYGGISGSKPGQLQQPCGLALDAHGNILVADCANHRIQKFSWHGIALASVGTMGNKQLQFSFPEDVAYNHITKKLYIVDGNHRVQVLNSNFSFSSVFGKKGSSKGQFSNPSGVACDKDGNVYVADYNNHRIQVFTPEGLFLRMFGQHGEGRGQLKQPVSICFDSNNLLFVTECGNHRVSVFTSEGRFVTTFGQERQGPLQMVNPSGVAADINGILYVCDFGNDKVLLI